MVLGLMQPCVRQQPHLRRVCPTNFVQTWQKTIHESIHMHIVLFRDSVKDGRLATILVEKPRCRTHPQPFLRHAFTDLVQTWHTDNE